MKLVQNDKIYLIIIISFYMIVALTDKATGNVEHTTSNKRSDY